MADRQRREALHVGGLGLQRVLDEQQLLRGRAPIAGLLPAELENPLHRPQQRGHTLQLLAVRGYEAQVHAQVLGQAHERRQRWIRRLHRVVEQRGHLAANASWLA